MTCRIRALVLQWHIKFQMLVYHFLAVFAIAICSICSAFRFSVVFDCCFAHVARNLFKLFIWKDISNN